MSTAPPQQPPSQFYQPPVKEAKPPSNLGTEHDVKALLRLCHEPLTIFGEDATQRKNRLAKHVKLYFASLPPAAIALLNKINGIGEAVRRAQLAADATNSGKEVRVADSFGTASPAVVAFRRAMLDNSLELQKRRISGLKNLFTQHRLAVAQLPPQAVSEESAAALLQGKQVSTQEKLANLHNNSHVNVAITNKMRMEAMGCVKRLAKQLVVSAPGEENMGLGGILYSTQTCAAVNPNTFLGGGGGGSSSFSSSFSGSEVAVGYTDGRVWLYDSGSGDLVSSSSSAYNSSNADNENSNSSNPLAERGRNRVADLCWRPRWESSAAASAAASSLPQSCSSSSSDVLFVARRQNEVEMWQIDRTENKRDADADDNADNEEGNGGAEGDEEEASVVGGNSAFTTTTSSRLVATLDRHVAFVNRLACDPSGSLLVSTSDDMTACLWDVRRSQSTATIDLAAGGGGDGSSSTTTPPCLYQQDGHDIKSVNNTVWAIDFHPDGAAFATSDAAGIVLLWDARSGLRIGRGGTTHTGRATCLKWLPTGFHLCSGGDDGVVHLYDTRKLAKPLFSIAAHTDTITSISCGGGYSNPSSLSSFSASSPSSSSSSAYIPQWLCTAGLDSRVSLWSADDGAHLRTLEGGPIRRGVGALGRGIGGGVGAAIGKLGAAAAAVPYRFALPVVLRQHASFSSSSFTFGIMVGARDRNWSLWKPSVDGYDAGQNEKDAAPLTTKTFAPVSSTGAALATSTATANTAAARSGGGGVADRESDDSDSDDDGLAALRKKPRVEAPPPPAAVVAAAPPPPPPKPAAVAAGDSDDDSDDDALAGLRKK